MVTDGGNFSAVRTTVLDLNRRNFLKVAGAAATVETLLGPKTHLLAEAQSEPAKPVAANDQIQIALIGAGGQGQGDTKVAVQVPGVKLVAVADCYTGRLEHSKELWGSDIFTTRNYAEILERKDIDAVIIGTPDHWHKQVAVDAMKAGKDVYCEKPMSHNPADGLAMVAAQKKTDRIVQIGAQRTSSVLCAKAKELVEQGAIGDLNLVEATLGRNDPTGAWEYPIPSDLSPETLDWDTWQGTAPKKAFDPYAFARWRCWKEYGTGVAGDLLVHLISGMQFVLGINEVPKRVSAFGGIYRWKDGRNMPDVHPALYEYGNIPVYMRLSLGCESAEVTRFQGSKGMIELREFSVTYIPQAGIDLSPSYYSASFPAAMRDAYVKQWHEEHDPAPGKEPAPETVTYNGNDYDDLRPHLWKFFESVRSRKPLVQDTVFGHHAALGCHLANESYFRKAPVYWDEASETIKSMG